MKIFFTVALILAGFCSIAQERQLIEINKEVNDTKKVDFYFEKRDSTIFAISKIGIVNKLGEILKLYYAADTLVFFRDFGEDTSRNTGRITTYKNSIGKDGKNLSKDFLVKIVLNESTLKSPPKLRFWDKVKSGNDTSFRYKAKIFFDLPLMHYDSVRIVTDSVNMRSTHFFKIKNKSKVEDLVFSASEVIVDQQTKKSYNPGDSIKISFKAGENVKELQFQMTLDSVRKQKFMDLNPTGKYLDSIYVLSFKNQSMNGLLSSLDNLEENINVKFFMNKPKNPRISIGFWVWGVVVILFGVFIWGVINRYLKRRKFNQNLDSFTENLISSDSGIHNLKIESLLLEFLEKNESLLNEVRVKQLIKNLQSGYRTDSGDGHQRKKLINLFPISFEYKFQNEKLNSYFIEAWRQARFETATLEEKIDHYWKYEDASIDSILKGIHNLFYSHEENSNK